MWVSGLAGPSQPHGGGDMECVEHGAWGLVRVRVLSACQRILVRAGVGRWCGCHFSPGKEGGVGARGAVRYPVPGRSCACSASRILRAGVTSHLERRQSVGCGGPSTGVSVPAKVHKPSFYGGGAAGGQVGLYPG